MIVRLVKDLVGLGFVGTGGIVTTVGGKEPQAAACVQLVRILLEEWLAPFALRVQARPRGPVAARLVPLDNTPVAAWHAQPVL